MLQSLSVRPLNAPRALGTRSRRMHAQTHAVACWHTNTRERRGERSHARALSERRRSCLFISSWYVFLFDSGRPKREFCSCFCVTRISHACVAFVRAFVCFCLTSFDKFLFVLLFCFDFCLTSFVRAFAKHENTNSVLDITYESKQSRLISYCICMFSIFLGCKHVYFVRCSNLAFIKIQPFLTYSQVPGATCGNFPSYPRFCTLWFLLCFAPTPPPRKPGKHKKQNSHKIPRRTH